MISSVFARRDGGGGSGQEVKKQEVASAGGGETQAGGEKETDSSVLMDHDDIESNKVSASSSVGNNHANCKEENGDGRVAASVQRIKDSNRNIPVSSPSWKKQARAFLRTLFAIDHTQIAFVPAMRTALILMVAVSIPGLDNHRSTAFRLGALFVGLTDPNGSFSKRLRGMGLTLLSVVFFGTLLPGLTWHSFAATICTAFIVALLTGLSPLVGSSPALFLAMKLGMALFAINGGVNRSTNGYGGLGNGVFWTFCGSSISLAVALLPEIIGNRDAVRTDLFKVWHGFGVSLRRWGRHWGTVSHWNVQPVPTVTQSVSATKAMISDDETEEAVAKDWQLKIMESADRIRVASLCFSNDVFQTMSCNSEGSEAIDAFFLAVGRACNRISFALQFPWLVRYVPFLKDKAAGAVDAVNETAAAVSVISVKTCESKDDYLINWLPSIAELIRSEVQSVSELVSAGKTWPNYSSLCSLPRRIIAAFPATVELNEDATWAIRDYALRLALAFTLATIPEVIIKKSNAYWFPMTVAFIMGPSQAATYEKVVHRVVGTLLGLGLGTAMTPLFRFHPALIILLGLNTYASVLFFKPNYALFTFFITGWVYVTIVGAGASVGLTTLYRCGWTLAAGALVVIVMYTYPPKALDNIGEKLAEVAKTVGSFAQAALEQSHLRRLSLQENHENKELLAAAETAKAKVAEIRSSVIKARIAMLTCINEAALTPSEGYRIDPYSLAPCLAGDLVNAVVIPQTVLLVADGSADGLLSDFDQETFSELDRLVKRLELQAQVTTSTATQRTAIAPSPSDRGPFSNAIARAHHRLDESGIPSF